MPLNEKALQRRIKQHIYAKDHRFFAVVQPGFESAARRELEALPDITEISEVEGGLEFTAPVESVWLIHLCACTVTRVLLRVGIFRALFWDELKEKSAELPWELYLNPAYGISFSVSCHHSKLYHTGRIEQEIRAAAVKRFRTQGLKWKIPEHDYEGQKILVRFEDDVCTLSLDFTGEPLYRRGYKTDVNEAPLRETLAAAILGEAGIGSYDLLLDPMCGSGTIPIEGAMIRNGIRPGLFRKFSFEGFPFFPEARFQYLRKSVLPEESSSAPFHVFASDIDEPSLTACRANAERAGVTAYLSIEKKDFFTASRAEYPEGRLLLCMNPPYGERLAAWSNSLDFYRALGEKIRTSFKDCGFAVIVPGEDAEKAFALHWDRKILFKNGGLKVALLLRA